MKYCSRLLALAALVIGIALGNAWAVGYERQDTNGARGVSKASRQVCPTFWDALKQLPLVTKIPDAVDGFASGVKEIFAQFGVNPDKKR